MKGPQQAHVGRGVGPDETPRAETQEAVAIQAMGALFAIAQHERHTLARVHEELRTVTDVLGDARTLPPAVELRDAIEAFMRTFLLGEPPSLMPLRGVHTSCAQAVKAQVRGVASDSGSASDVDG